MTEFDPFEMCRILNEEKVDYVVLGVFAANWRVSRKHATHAESGG